MYRLKFPRYQKEVNFMGIFDIFKSKDKKPQDDSQSTPDTSSDSDKDNDDSASE